MSALHRFLVDFGQDAGSPAQLWSQTGSSDLPVGIDGWPGDEIDPESGELSLAIDIEEPALDAVAEAVAAALAEAAEAEGERLAARDAAHAEQLAAERARWVAGEGASLAEGLARARAEIEDALAEGAVAVLEPFLAEAARAAAVAELRSAIADLVVSGTAASIAVSGPADLVEALGGALAAGGIEPSRVVLTEAEAVDVTVTADSSTVRTRLEAWAATLQRHLGDAP